MVSRRTAFQDPGGGEVQLNMTKEYLEEKGVHVDVFDHYEHEIEDYDILHAFGTSPENISLIEYANEAGLKTFLSPIFWDQAAYENKIKWRIKNALKESLRSLIRKTGIETFDRKSCLETPDVLLPNSEMEGEVLRRKYGLEGMEIVPVPNGVSEEFEGGNKELFESDVPFENFDIFVGRLEPRKNLDKLIHAYNDIDRNIVIIGPEMEEYRPYAKDLKQKADENIHFFGKVEFGSDLHKSAYKSANKLVLPSKCETPGLVALEAGMMGTKISITQNGSTKEYFEDYVGYINPGSVNSIKEAVKAESKQEGLENHIKQNFTWDKVAKETKNAYERLL